MGLLKSHCVHEEIEARREIKLAQDHADGVWQSSHCEIFLNMSTVLCESKIMLEMSLGMKCKSSALALGK